jgi:hypothetical protein
MVVFMLLLLLLLLWCSVVYGASGQPQACCYAV